MNSPSAHEEEIFLTALEIADEAERERYLESTCERDNPLRETVDLLLADHEQASTLFREVGQAITLTAPSDPAMDRDVGAGRRSAPTPSPNLSAKVAVVLSLKRGRKRRCAGKSP